MKRVLRIQYNSPVVLTFSALALLALILNHLTGGWTTTHLFCVYRAPFTDPLTYVRFFTHVLGHTGYEHYIGNILLILVIGPSLEEKYGSWPLLRAILITAFLSGLVQFSFFPGTALLGASGIVFMMIVMSSLSGMRGGAIPLTLIFVMVFYIGGEVVNAITQTDNISQLTHIIGGVCGAIIGFSLAKRR